MPKLRSDPVTHPLYYRCAPLDAEPAKAAMFGWDPVRRRVTEPSNVAANLYGRGDIYARLLLADVREAVTWPQHRRHVRRSLQQISRTKGAAVPSFSRLSLRDDRLAVVGGAIAIVGARRPGTVDSARRIAADSAGGSSRSCPMGRNAQAPIAMRNLLAFAAIADDTQRGGALLTQRKIGTV